MVSRHWLRRKKLGVVIRVAAAGTAVLLFVSAAFPAEAAWTANPSLNDAVCTAPGVQYGVEAISDGAGGAIILWQDRRTAANGGGLYVQKLKSDGAPVWQSGGIRVDALGYIPALVSDGAGGAIVAWKTSLGNSVSRLCAQRIDSSGTLLWDVNGVSLGTEEFAAETFDSWAAPDGNGGAVFVWSDYPACRCGPKDMFAQRVNASGEIQWEPDGKVIGTKGTAPEPYETPLMFRNVIQSAPGEWIAFWVEDLGIQTQETPLFAQKFTTSGDTPWTTAALMLTSFADNQIPVPAAPDGNGGAYVCWKTYGQGLRAARVDTSGTLPWGAEGAPVCPAFGNQHWPTMIPSESGHAIVAWHDFRNGTDADIYTQKLDGNGTLLWSPAGAPACTAPTDQNYVSLTTDGAGGAILGWGDYRNASTAVDIYAQRINGSGVPQWTTNGIPVTTASKSQAAPAMVSDNSGGAIFAWFDYRNSLTDGLDGSANPDIFMSRVNNGTLVPVALSRLEIE